MSDDDFPVAAGMSDSEDGFLPAPSVATTQATKRKDKATVEREEEEVAAMRAKTMYNMGEDLPSKDGEQRLLFLTNNQANLLAQDAAKAIPRLLDAFEVGDPKLLIQFLGSPGGMEWYGSRPGEEGEPDPVWPGVKNHKPPWVQSCSASFASLDLLVSLRAASLCQSK